MSTDKATIEHISIALATNPTFRNRVVSHYRKWWWAHLVVLTICVLTVTLPLVYVGYPNIAQSDIDDSTLTISALIITDPSPVGFDLNMTQTIGTGSIFHPTVFEFKSEVGLAGEESSSPFATVTVPDVVAKDGATMDIQQWVELTNETTFTDFVITLLKEEYFGISVSGKPKLKLGALPTIDVSYKKDVTLKGLNNLKGLQVVELSLDSGLDDGNNARGRVFIPNLSVMTLTMGNVTVNLSSNGTSLGRGTIPDLVLVPGNNTVDMVSKLNQEKLVQTLSQLPENTSTISLTIAGNSSTYDGQDIPYLTAALSSTTFDMQLNLLELLGH
ncbi:hypothetical protein BJY01DRAFT_261854 [Aspergillus pseudoustus]|uniref:Uncharacterized protein n=1 Tax=Aspergillus pseudoustus TaxID=1810923 RepID=A0ABR4KG49_9EURO